MPQIKFLNKFVLANILKNFRWLKFVYTKLKHLKCPRCYSLSLRYSIYKVQFATHRFAVTAFELYHAQFRLSRTFFKFFQTFLRGFLRSLLAEQPRYVSTSASICQALFQFFSSFFRICCFILSPRGNLHILAHRLYFVKHFSTKFSVFFRALFPKKKEPFSRLLILYCQLLCIIDQAIATFVSAVYNSEGTAVILVPEGKEVMIQQVHLHDRFFPVRNFIFVSPHFPVNYRNFCIQLHANGVNVLAPFKFLGFCVKNRPDFLRCEQSRCFHTHAASL